MVYHAAALITRLDVCFVCAWFWTFCVQFPLPSCKNPKDASVQTVKPRRKPEITTGLRQKGNVLEWCEQNPSDVGVAKFDPSRFQRITDLLNLLKITNPEHWMLGCSKTDHSERFCQSLAVFAVHTVTLYEHRVLKAWMKIYNMLHFPQVILVFCRVQVFYLPHVHIQPPAVVKPFFSGKEKSPSSTVPQVIPPPHATKNIWTVSSYQCLNRMNTEQQPMDLWIYIMFYWGYPLVN